LVRGSMQFKTPSEEMGERPLVSPVSLGLTARLLWAIAASTVLWLAAAWAMEWLP
jgi:hypothetical protein